MTTDMSDRRSNFRQLLQQVAEGSEEAAWEIVERYSPNILRAVRRAMPDTIRTKVDSVDIMQSVWMSLLTREQGLADLETPDRFVAYLVAAARHKVWQTYRHYTRTQARSVYKERRLDDSGVADWTGEEGFLVSDEPTGSAVASAREAWARAIEQFSERDRKVVKLRLMGWTSDQIADHIHATPRTIRRIIDRLYTLMTR